MSPAYLAKSMFHSIRKRPLTKLLKSKGPKVEPCRNPKKIFSNELYMEPVLILCLNSYIKILTIVIAKPHACKLSINKLKKTKQLESFGKSFESAPKQMWALKLFRHVSIMDC